MINEELFLRDRDMYIFNLLELNLASSNKKRGGLKCLSLKNQ